MARRNVIKSPCKAGGKAKGGRGPKPAAAKKNKKK